MFIKKTIIITAITLFILNFICGCGGSSNSAVHTDSQGDRLYAMAVQHESNKYYYTAISMYEQALVQYRAENNSYMASKCRARKFSLCLLIAPFPYSEPEIRDALKEQYPEIPISQKETWLANGMLDYILIDGRKQYFSETISNVLYRSPNLFPENSPSWEKFKGIRQTMLQMIKDTPAYDGNPYIKPSKYMGTYTVNVSRNKFPEHGLLKVWIPYPVETDSQKDIKTVTIEPAQFWKSGPDTKADLGNIYFEIPLDQLTNDLSIKVQFTFNQYQQNFEIDPSKVGTYDTESSLYKTYTTSAGNTTITSEIKAKALAIVGSEKNPYLQAKKIFNYITNNVKYSYTPHAYLQESGMPESVYVHTYNVGDCGAQSIYFCALCRSLGIPARSIGGFQILVEGGSPHFWSEIYLPNYGWVPNDTTLTEVINLSPYFPAEENKILQDYLFQCLDSKRLIIQKDVDLPVSPPKNDERLFTATLQSPDAECLEMDDDVRLSVCEGFKSNIVPYN